MTATANPIDVVETAYALELDERAWLARVATALLPLLDGGRGIIAYLADPRRAPATWLDEAVLVDAPACDVEAARAFMAGAPELARQGHNLPPTDTLASLGDLPPILANSAAMAECTKQMHANGVYDNAHLGTLEPGGHGVNFVAAQRSPRRFDTRAKRLWARVAAHVAAARRLRTALLEPDAVLTPGGRVEHAEGDARDRGAREILHEAVLRQDKARGRLRREDPARATEAWTALVAGRWSLVDQFERGGRRYIVARRNEHALPDPRALTPRERAIAHLAALGKPNKLVAYELGLSESTIATHLAAAMRKLRVTSRVELVRALATVSWTK